MTQRSTQARHFRGFCSTRYRSAKSNLDPKYGAQVLSESGARGRGGSTLLQAAGDHTVAQGGWFCHLLVRCLLCTFNPPLSPTRPLTVYGARSYDDRGRPRIPTPPSCGGRRCRPSAVARRFFGTRWPRRRRASGGAFGPLRRAWASSAAQGRQ